MPFIHMNLNGMNPNNISDIGICVRQSLGPSCSHEVWAKGWAARVGIDVPLCFTSPNCWGDMSSSTNIWLCRWWFQPIPKSWDINPNPWAAKLLRCFTDVRWCHGCYYVPACWSQIPKRMKGLHREIPQDLLSQKTKLVPSSSKLHAKCITYLAWA